MKIYKSWYGNFRQWLFIETMFKKSVEDSDVYTAIVKTMRYIGNYMRYANPVDKEVLKKDLYEVRSFYNQLFTQ